MSLTCLQIAKAADLYPGRVSGAEHLFRCPRHEDEHPSLHVNSAKDVFLCGPCGAAGTAWQFAAFLAGVDPSDKRGVREWLRVHVLGDHNQGNQTERPPSPPVSIVATYPYTDENGELAVRTGMHALANSIPITMPNHITIRLRVTAR